MFSRERNNPSLYQPKSGKKLSKDDIKAHLTNTIRPLESRLKTVSSFLAQVAIVLPMKPMAMKINLITFDNSRFSGATIQSLFSRNYTQALVYTYISAWIKFLAPCKISVRRTVTSSKIIKINSCYVSLVVTLDVHRSTYQISICMYFNSNYSAVD